MPEHLPCRPGRHALLEQEGGRRVALTLGTCSHVVPELAQDAADRDGDALWG